MNINVLSLILSVVFWLYFGCIFFSENQPFRNIFFFTFKHIKIMSRITLTLEEWRAKAEPKFGKDVKNWKFKCCQCGESQTLQDFIDANIEGPYTKFFFSCIGRWVKGRGCNWTLGGLLQIHDTEVISEEGKNIPVFEFAE